MQLKVMRRYGEGDYVIRFFKGLNEEFAVVRSQMMLLDPFPSINKAFSLIPRFWLMSLIKQ